jgi:putative transcriptional regulator
MRSVSALRLHRLAHGWSQTELGRRVGITRQLLSKLETGQIPPRLDLARALAQALESDVDEVFPSVRPSAVDDVALPDQEVF